MPNVPRKPAGAPVSHAKNGPTEGKAEPRLSARLKSHGGDPGRTGQPMSWVKLIPRTPDDAAVCVIEPQGVVIT